MGGAAFLLEWLATSSLWTIKDNVRISDRLRPSNEQLSAQKGAQRLQMILESALRHCKFDAVLVVNLTGYVEELAVAASCCSLVHVAFKV